MAKFKITKEHVKGFVRGCCLAAYGVAAIAGACIVKSNSTENTNSYSVVLADYSDAVQHIMRSSMLGSQKTEAIGLLRREEDSAYYNAVISIVNSSMLGSQKIEAIEKISKN